MNEITKKDKSKKVVNLSFNNLLPFIIGLFVVLFILGDLSFVELMLLVVIFFVASKIKPKIKGSDIK
jgi:hypothetical protein